MWAFWKALDSVLCHGTDPVFIYFINIYGEDLLNAREYGETWRHFRHDSTMNFAQYKQWRLEEDLRFANNYEEEIAK